MASGAGTEGQADRQDHRTIGATRGSFMLSHKTLLMALALTACTDATACHDGSEDSAMTAQFQGHLDALHADGMVGVVGEIDADGARIQAHSGSAELDSNQAVAFDSRFRIG